VLLVGLTAPVTSVKIALGVVDKLWRFGQRASRNTDSAPGSRRLDLYVVSPECSVCRDQSDLFALRLSD